MANSLQIIELIAGTNPTGQPIIEQVPVRILEDEGKLQLVKSPAFIQGLAAGDTITYNADAKDYTLVKRSGHLAIRVFCRGDTEKLAESLGPELEKLGGELDTENERMIIFSAHVSLGFQKIEDILNDHVGEDSDSIWLYGNVYDGEGKPLNWWQDVVSES